MVSIIIPAYNVEKYIDECIKSVINQSYKNIEIIIVNDGSTDNTKQKIEKYLVCNNNIIYLEQKNKGVSEARNLGLQKASGKYIMFVDPDDYLDKCCVEKMINKIISTESDIVICGFRSFYQNKIHKDKFHKYEIEDKIYTNQDVLNMILEYKVKGFVWDKLFKREQLIRNNFKFEPGRYVQDWYPVFRQVYKSEKITFINESLYNYRLREGSTVHKKNMKVTEDYYHAVTSIKNYINHKKIEISSSSMKTFNINTFYNLIRNYYLAFNNPKKEVYNEFSKSKYSSEKIFISDLFFNNNVSKKVIFKILLWKSKIFHFIYPL